MRKTLLLTFVSALTAFSCQTKKNMTKEKEPVKPLMSIFPSVEIIDGYTTPKDNAAYEIKSLTVDGDVLEIIVSYSGGCKEHQWALKCNKMFKKSLPPQKDLTLEHNNNDDNCRGWKTDTLKFDVSPTKYPGKDKDYTVTLNISGAKEGVAYKY